MLKPEQVPKEVVEAAAVMLSNGKTTAQAIAAAINAWPGKHVGPSPADARRHSIILHLPTEGA